MPEHIFSCPNCRREISCDAALAGQQVQCPLCQTTVTVPQSQGAPPPPQPKLAIGRSQQADASTRSKPVYRQLVAPPPKQQSPLLKWATVAVVLAALGVGAYFGYGWYQQHREAANASPAGTQATPADPGGPGVAAADPGGVAAPKPAEKELPLIPATWTLDLEAAKTPEGRANGAVSGTNFVVETARLDFVGTAYLLSLRQGGGVSPDREIQVFLRPKAGQPLTNQTWTVTKDMKGPGVPQVVKRWKTNPKYAPRQKAFSSGYAMKLELGQASEDGISGKIFLALPDPEQSVVAGVFKAVVGLTSAVGPATATQPAPPTPQMPPNPEFERRYGTKR